jgi:hypothetical protein
MGHSLFHYLHNGDTKSFTEKTDKKGVRKRKCPHTSRKPADKCSVLNIYYGAKPAIATSTTKFYVSQFTTTKEHNRNTLEQLEDLRSFNQQQLRRLFMCVLPTL